MPYRVQVAGVVEQLVQTLEEAQEIQANLKEDGLRAEVLDEDGQIIPPPTFH